MFSCTQPTRAAFPGTEMKMEDDFFADYYEASGMGFRDPAHEKFVVDILNNGENPDGKEERCIAVVSLR